MNIKSIIFKFLKFLFIVFILTFLASMFYKYVYIRPVVEFCDQIKSSDSSVKIIRNASIKDLVISNMPDDLKIVSGRLMIFNQISPLGRFACVIQFENGQVIAKEVIEAD